MNPRRQSGLDLLDFLFYPVDDVLGVLAGTRHNHSTNRFGAVLDQSSGAEGVADLDDAQILHENGRAAMRTDHDVSDIVEILDQAKAAHDGPGTVLGDDIAAHIRIAGHHGAHHGAERNAVRAQPVGIDIDLVLLYRATDARYFGNTGN